MVRLTDTGVLITEKGLNCLRQLKQANAVKNHHSQNQKNEHIVGKNNL
jgi:hypothetical protein